MSLGVHPGAFSSEALKETFEDDMRGDVILENFPKTNIPPPRPNNLPEYLIARYGYPLKSDGRDMSKADIIDFGKGSLLLTPTGYPIEMALINLQAFLLQ